MSARETPATVRDTVEAVTQCVLRVDERSVGGAKAEGRDEGVRGSVLHWPQEDGLPVAPAERVAASLREVRRSRAPSQHDLTGLAGVTASAISQAERVEGWRNLGQTEAVLFWIVASPGRTTRLRALGERGMRGICQHRFAQAELGTGCLVR